MTREREVGMVRGSLEEGDERQKLRQSIIWPLCFPIFCALIFLFYFCNYTLFAGNVKQGCAGNEVVCWTALVCLLLPCKLCMCKARGDAWLL